MTPRPLAPSDRRALALALAGIDPWAALGYGALALEDYLGRDDPALARFVVEADGDIAAVIALRSPWLRGPSIELLAVFPGHQGRGLGGTLLEWAAARAAGSANLWACVSAFNAGARRFYTAHGFAEAAALADLVAVGETEILLRRRLKG